MITHLEIEKKLNEVNNKLNHLKDDSIYIQSKEERINLFYNIKREEQEKLKAEEEKRIKALNK